jgi:hypothetical protein
LETKNDIVIAPKANGKAKMPSMKDLLECLMALKQGNISPRKPKHVWTDDMVHALLDLRLVQFKTIFEGSKSNMQLSVAWEKITLRSNPVCRTNAPSASLKNKYHTLKKTSRRFVGPCIMKLGTKRKIQLITRRIGTHKLNSLATKTALDTTSLHQASTMNLQRASASRPHSSFFHSIFIFIV